MTRDAGVRSQPTHARAYQAALEPMVSVLAVWGLVEAVAQAGVPQQRFLRTIGWSSERLQLMDEQVPLAEVMRIGELAIDATEDEALGVHWADRLGPSTFTPVSHMLSHVHSLRHGFELITSFERLFCDRAIFSVLDNGSTSTIHVSEWPNQTERMHRFIPEVIVAGMTKMIREVYPGAKILQVNFAHSAPPYAAEYARVLACEVRFAQPFTGLMLERAQLDAPLPHVDEDVFRALKLVAERRLEGLSERTPYTIGLRELILRRAPKRTSMHTAARALGLSERSLRRQLTAEGTSFREVEYTALGSVAKWMLRERKCTIQEVAFELGYADTATFHRAFKRWTGTTPSAFRSDALES